MPERPLVAIVDDDESHRRATQSLLRAAGLSTAVFADAESFLRSAIRASFEFARTSTLPPSTKNGRLKSTSRIRDSVIVVVPQTASTLPLVT